MDNVHYEDGYEIDKYDNGLWIYYHKGILSRLEGPALDCTRVPESDPDTGVMCSTWYFYGESIDTDWIYDNIKDPFNITKEEQVFIKLVWGFKETKIRRF